MTPSGKVVFAVAVEYGALGVALISTTTDNMNIGFQSVITAPLAAAAAPNAFRKTSSPKVAVAATILHQGCVDITRDLPFALQRSAGRRDRMN